MLVLVLAASLPIRLANAGPSAEPSPVQKSTADALFTEGKKLMEAGDYAQACPKLEESARLRPGGGVQLAKAICHEGQGKLATAWNDYREALAMAKHDNQPKREEIATQKLVELESKLSRVTVSLLPAARAQEPTVTLDGLVLGAASLGVAIPVDVGAHVVAVSKAGFVATKFDVVVNADKENRSLEIGPLVAAPIETPVLPPKPDLLPSASGGNAGPWILGGIGVVAIGVGTVFGIKAATRSSDAKAGCPNGVCVDQAALDRHDDVQRSARIANLGIGIGSVAVAGAIVWMIASSSNTKPPGSLGDGLGTLSAAVGPRDASLGWTLPF